MCEYLTYINPNNNSPLKMMSFGGSLFWATRKKTSAEHRRLICPPKIIH